MKKICLIIIFLFFTAHIVQAQQYVPGTNNILYVKQNAIGSGNGSSWNNAVPDLADALKWAHTNRANFVNNPLQIWVATGTYKPKYSPQDGSNFGTDQNRDNSFLMVKNVQLYGGFLGTETLLRERNFKTILTTLSGDINTENNFSDNTYHVVVSANDVGSAKIDVFIITKGNADATNSITIKTKMFYRNSGGGIYNHSSSPTLSNTIISDNSARFGGGGIINLNSSSPTITYTTITNNSANNGGGF